MLNKPEMITALTYVTLTALTQNVTMLELNQGMSQHACHVVLTANDKSDMVSAQPC